MKRSYCLRVILAYGHHPPVVEPLVSQGASPKGEYMSFSSKTDVHTHPRTELKVGFSQVDITPPIVISELASYHCSRENSEDTSTM